MLTFGAGSARGRGRANVLAMREVRIRGVYFMMDVVYVLGGCVLGCSESLKDRILDRI